MHSSQCTIRNCDLEIPIRHISPISPITENIELKIENIKQKTNMSKVIEGLRYADSHEWVKVEGDIAVVGISDYAQHALGNIVYVDLPEVGDEVTAGEDFGAVESVKAASDLISPVSGEVVEINEQLEDEPEAINADPYGAWIIKVKISDASEIDALLDAAAYEKFCENE